MVCQSKKEKKEKKEEHSPGFEPETSRMSFSYEKIYEVNKQKTIVMSIINEYVGVPRRHGGVP